MVPLAAAVLEADGEADGLVCGPVASLVELDEQLHGARWGEVTVPAAREITAVVTGVA